MANVIPGPHFVSFNSRYCKEASVIARREGDRTHASHSSSRRRRSRCSSTCVQYSSGGAYSIRLFSLAGAGRVWSVAASSAAGQCTNWYHSSITAGVIRSVE